MNPELRRYIRETTLNRAAIRHIQTMLPDNTELDAWFEQTAADYAGDEFLCLVIAALDAGREVHARHLAKGAAALAAGDMLPEIAMKMTGDIPGYLMQAVRGAFMNQRGKAVALGIAAVMHQDRGEDIPQAVSSITRALAHSENVEAEALPALHGLVMYLGDDELNRSLRQRYFSKLTEAAWRRQCDAARTFPDALRQQGAMPVMELIGEKAERYVAMGNAPMRRSVPRIGRNDPCHCGSGKKYKHCCFEADRVRLRQSSDIEGVTRQERQESPEEYLTEDRLKTMMITDVLALDPDRIPCDVLDTYFERLCYWKEFDRAAEAVEKMGFWLVGPETWENLAFRLAFYGRSNAFQRVLEVRRKAGVADTTLDMTYQLALIQDDPVKSWDWLDDEALSVIRSGDPDDLRQLAFALLLTKHQPVGILLARGVIPLVSSPDASSSLIDWVLEARRQLTLDPDDPINDIADMVSTAKHEASEIDAALRETRELLELKAREARQAKESRDQALREVNRREEEMARKHEAEAATATPEEVAALKELRRKAEKYEQEIRERNTERSSLRRQLRKKELELDAMRSREETKPGQTEADSQEAPEDELLLPDEAESTKIHQPLRVIDFPNNFEQRLKAVPQSVARGALNILARMAGGEDGAFSGAVRLRACPSVRRHRITGYRLLFRLLPDRIQVLDLIPRGELERKIKVLAGQYD